MGVVIPLRGRPDGADGAELRRRFRDGDPEAFEAVVAPQLDDLYTFCLRVTGRPEDAWDLTHDALVRARTKHHLFDPARPVRPWLLTIARNVWRSGHRSPWIRLRTTFADWMEDTSGSHGASSARSPEAQVDGDDRDHKVRLALAALPPIYREAVAMFHLQDMSYAEMEEVTGTPVPALKQRVRRGTVMLAERVAQMYPELVPDRRGGG